MLRIESARSGRPRSDANSEHGHAVCRSSRIRVDLSSTARSTCDDDRRRNAQDHGRGGPDRRVEARVDRDDRRGCRSSSHRQSSRSTAASVQPWISIADDLKPGTLAQPGHEDDQVVTERRRRRHEHAFESGSDRCSARLLGDAVIEIVEQSVGRHAAERRVAAVHDRRQPPGSIARGPLAMDPPRASVPCVDRTPVDGSVCAPPARHGDQTKTPESSASSAASTRSTRPTWTASAGLRPPR